MTITRDNYLYQSYYCEENIWHLCQGSEFEGSFVVFIFSQANGFPMKQQRVMESPSQPIFWDYHVVLLQPSRPNLIFDFDTTLAFGLSVNTYVSESFFPAQQLQEEYRPLFRVIPSDVFARVFSSDRSHMKIQGGWSATPPMWPKIVCGDNNLSRFNSNGTAGFGKVLSQVEFLESWGS